MRAAVNHSGGDVVTAVAHAPAHDPHVPVDAPQATASSSPLLDRCYAGCAARCLSLHRRNNAAQQGGISGTDGVRVQAQSTSNLLLL